MIGNFLRRALILLLLVLTLTDVSIASQSEVICSDCSQEQDTPTIAPVGESTLDSTLYPSLAFPTATTTSQPRGNENIFSPTSGVDFLVAPFFLIAAGWLVLALLYSILVLIVVRLRARGELDLHDENFGRLFLFGNSCYIPLGCLIRRYVVALHQPEHIPRFMTRDERRIAMEEVLLIRGVDEERQEIIPNQQLVTPSPDVASVASTTEGPICCICLMEYGT